MHFRCIFFGLLGTLCLTVCCTKEPVGFNNDEQVRAVFSIDQIKEGLSSKSVLIDTNFFWEASDTVGIYPNTGSQIFFAMTDGAGSSTAIFDGGGWAFKSGSTYYSYLPFIPDFYLDRKHIPVSFSGQRQDGQGGISGVRHIGKYDYMYADPATVKDGAISFSYHHLVTFIYCRVTLGPGTYKQLTITAPNEIFTTEGYFNLTDKKPEIIALKTSKELSIVLDNLSLKEETTFDINLVSAPVDLSGKKIVVSVLNENKEQFDCEKNITKVYTVGYQFGLACSSWTKVQQSVTVLVDDWEEGSHTDGDLQ